jgi:hypothetical protein
MRNTSRLILNLLLIALVSGGSLSADITYYYQGNGFDSLSLPPYTQTNAVTGNFTVAVPAYTNGYALPVNPSAWSISDGILTLNNFNTPLSDLSLHIASDAGIITHWFFSVTAGADYIVTECGALLQNTRQASYCFDMTDGDTSTLEGYSFQNPGTWTFAFDAPTPAPEPSAILLFGSAAALLLVLRRLTQ